MYNIYILYELVQKRDIFTKQIIHGNFSKCYNLKGMTTLKREFIHSDPRVENFLAQREYFYLFAEISGIFFSRNLTLCYRGMAPDFVNTGLSRIFFIKLGFMVFFLGGRRHNYPSSQS